MRGLFRYCVLSLVFVAFSVFSQVNTPTIKPVVIPSESTPLERKIWESIDRIQQRRAELMHINHALSRATGEAEESILLQRLDYYDAMLTELNELSSLISSYQDSGGEPQQLLSEYESGLLRTGSRLRQEIDQYRDRFISNDRARDTQTTDGLKAYTADSKLIDMAYGLLHQYARVMVSMGYNADPSFEYLRDNLPRRAKVLAGRIRLTVQRQKELAGFQSADENAGLKKTLLDQKLQTDTQSLQYIIDMSTRLDLDVSQYQALLVKSTGQISSDLLDSDVLGELFHDWWISSKLSFKSNFSNLLFKSFAFIFVLLVFRLIAHVAKRLIKRSVQSASVRLSRLMQDMVISMTSRLIMLLGLLVALAQVGVSLGPLLAGLGVVGFVLGFALQDTLGNFAAGVMILIYRPYDVGDFVEAAGSFGKVKSMNIVSTTILTIDNQTLIVPNNKIWGDVIKNVTAQRVRRIDMVFGIGYSDSIEQAEQVLADIIHSHKKILSDPEPIIKLNTLGESSVDFVVRPWARTEDYWEVYWDVTRSVKLRFDEEGISIPFPQRDVHVYQEKTTDAQTRQKRAQMVREAQ